MWEENAADWTALARAGYDVYRDLVNTPAFLEMLPEVSGLRGLDVGCGEGNNTRLVARRGARMTALDISPTFVRHARDEEAARPLGIAYVNASAVKLPFAAATFDFCMATMSIMDVPDQVAAVREAHRVLRRGGFFQFSISHPCFMTPRWKAAFDDEGARVAVCCGDYFACPQGVVSEWTFSATPEDIRKTTRKFRVPQFYRTLSSWLNILLDCGFALERFQEPVAGDETARRHPIVADTRIVAYFLHVRCRKPN
jgi:ubiquinone/menaquinone biosynthesis C-methylase UbiE